MAVTVVRGAQIKDADVSLTVDVTGTLPVANGGTGAATLAANNVLLGNGTSALQVVSPSTAGNILVANGTTWVTSTLDAAGVSGVTTLQVSNITSLTPAISAFRTYIEDTGLTGTVTLNNHSGTPGVGYMLWVSFTGTASRSIAYGTGYEDSGNVTRPTTTSGTARIDIGFIWNPATSKFRCVAYA